MTVSEISVFPAGRSRRSAAAERKMAGGQRLSVVRGHFASYGPDYGRGLLFGKHAGRFWHPQTTRGERAVGEARHDYRLVPE